MSNSFLTPWTVPCQAPLSVGYPLQARILSGLPFPPASAGDAGLIPGSGRPPGEGNGNPLSILAWSGYPTDRGAWQGTVHGVRKELDMT